MNILPKTNTPNTLSGPEANNIDLEEPPLTRFVKDKLASAAFAFVTAGVNDGSLCALVLYILRTYDICHRLNCHPFSLRLCWLSRRRSRCGSLAGQVRERRRAHARRPLATPLHVLRVWVSLSNRSLTCIQLD